MSFTSSRLNGFPFHQVFGDPIKISAIVKAAAEKIPREDVLHGVDLPGGFGMPQGLLGQFQCFGYIPGLPEVQRRPNQVEPQDQRLREKVQGLAIQFESPFQESCVGQETGAVGTRESCAAAYSNTISLAISKISPNVPSVFSLACQRSRLV